MPQVKPEDCELLASQLLDVTRIHDAHIGAGALIRALRAYGDALPEMRVALGRALLLLGGELVATSFPWELLATDSTQTPSLPH